MNNIRSMRGWLVVASVAVVLVMIVASDGRADKKDAIRQAGKAAEVFKEIMGVPDNAVPLSVLDRAVCVAVFPDVIKGGLIVGGRKGRGLSLIHI